MNVCEDLENEVQIPKLNLFKLVIATKTYKLHIKKMHRILRGQLATCSNLYLVNEF